MFHRYLDVAAIPPKGKSLRIEAEEAERADLAERFSLEEVKSFKGEITVTPLPKGENFVLEGKYEAEIVQICVISLQPFSCSVKGCVSRRYGPPPPEEEDIEILVEMDEEDPPEPLDEGRIDAAEALVEEFGVALDPFPKSPEAQFEGYQVGGEESEAESPGPFAALAALKDKMKE